MEHAGRFLSVIMVAGPGLVSGALRVCYLSKFPLPLLELHLPISCSGRQRESVNSCP